MSSKILRQLWTLLTVAIAAMISAVPVFAAPVNPATGDGSGMMMPIVGGLLGLSVVLIIVYIVLSKKKK